jgi:hypothetical protein
MAMPRDGPDDGEAHRLTSARRAPGAAPLVYVASRYRALHWLAPTLMRQEGERDHGQRPH